MTKLQYNFNPKTLIQILSQQLQTVLLQQQQQQQAAAAAAAAKTSPTQKPSELMANRLQSIIRSQAAQLGLIRPQGSAATSTPNIMLNSNLAGVIQKQSASQSCKFTSCSALFQLQHVGSVFRVTSITWALFQPPQTFPVLQPVF